MCEKSDSPNHQPPQTQVVDSSNTLNFPKPSTHYTSNTPQMSVASQNMITELSAIQFQQAVIDGNLALVDRLLLDPRVDPSAEDNRALRGASLHGHLSVVDRLLQDPRVDPSAEDNHAIQLASKNGYIEIVKRLWRDPRVDPSAQNNHALQLASMYGHLEIVKLLMIDKRVNPSPNGKFPVCGHV